MRRLVSSAARLTTSSHHGLPVESRAPGRKGDRTIGGVGEALRSVIEGLARERLGFERLRPGQLRAVEALAGGRDVLAVLPTGAGKSAIYELAGMLLEGPTVVVSPLIALQDDQIAHLHAAGLPAIVLNSQQSAGARAAALPGLVRRRHVRLPLAGAAGEQRDPGGAAARPAGTVRGGRSAPDQPVGPRLPSRLHEARRTGRGGRRAGSPGPDRDGRAAGAAGDRAAARPARSRGRDRRLRPASYPPLGAARAHAP